MSVVTSSTLPHSSSGKRHNILAYHHVWEATASKIIAYHWIQTGYNLSDMLSKHWDHPSVYSMIMKTKPPTIYPRENICISGKINVPFVCMYWYYFTVH